MCLFSGWACLILADAFMSISVLPNPRCSNCFKESCASKSKCGRREKEGGIFFLHRALGVQWHQSLSSGVEFTAGMYESDQPLMQGQWKRLPKTTWKHTSSLQTWFSSEMTYFITFPGGSGPKKASISPLVLTGVDGMSRNCPYSFTTNFPLFPCRPDPILYGSLFRSQPVVTLDPWLLCFLFL